MMLAQRQAVAGCVPRKDIRKELRQVSGWPAEKKRRLRPRRARLPFDIPKCGKVLVAGCGGRSVRVAVEQLPAARANAVEDRLISDTLFLKIPATASEHLFFAHPCLVLAGPVLTLLVPQHLTEV